MRATLLLVPALLIACSGGDAAPADEAMPEEATAPAALTAADVAGSWSGMTMAEGSDSVAARWTVTSTSDTTGTLTYEGSTEAIGYTARFDGDSMMVESFPYVDPAREDGMMVKFRSVGRLQADGQLAGTAQTMIVGSDSVVSRSTWHASRAN